MSKAYSRRRFIRTSAGITLAASPAIARLGASPTTDKKIKMGQIGTGHPHAAGKMKVFRENPRFEVLGVVEADPQLRQHAKTHPVYQGLKWMDQEQLLNSAGLEAVAVETRVSDLLEAAEACIKAGMHIHLDKPAGSSLPHFARILKDAQRQNLLIQMGYMYRYNPGVVLMRELLQKGWLGEPFEMHCVMSKRIRAESRMDLAAYTGGVMFDLGCHMIDLIVGMLGKPQDVAEFLRHAGRYEDRVTDNALAVLEYPRALATVKSSVLEVEGFARRHVVLCGTEGTIQIQPMAAPEAQFALLKARGSYRKGYQKVKLAPYTRYIDDIEDFAQIIRERKESAFTPQHDYNVQESLLRACGIPLT